MFGVMFVLTFDHRKYIDVNRTAVLLQSMKEHETGTILKIILNHSYRITIEPYIPHT